MEKAHTTGATLIVAQVTYYCDPLYSVPDYGDSEGTVVTEQCKAIYPQMGEGFYLQ